MKQKFAKRLQIGRAPTCLCIHFKRTAWQQDGTLHKNNTHVTFPLSLDASWLMRNPSAAASFKRVKYKLAAVIEHTGGPFSGHYVTYRRCGSAGRQWVHTSDTSVYTTRVEEVLNCRAYMLFYYQQTEADVTVGNSRQGFRSLPN